MSDRVRIPCLRATRSSSMGAGVLVALLGAGCGPSEPSSAPILGPLPPVDVTPGPGGLVRLTSAQLTSALQDLFGPGIEVGGPLEPDLPAAGLRQVGAARGAVSSWGVEQYEALALDVAEQAVTPGLDGWMPCPLAELGDPGCRQASLRTLAGRAWRRAPTQVEVTRLVDLATLGARELGDPRSGLAFAIAAVLQAPEFVYRVEVGEDPPVAPGVHALGPQSVATRLAFLLWAAPPDDRLLAAAAAGELDSTDGVRREAERLMASPRFRSGLRAFFEDVYRLYELDAVTKDPTAFVHFSTELGPAARQESLRFLEDLLLDRDGDYRGIFTAEHTFVDRRLAALYGVQAPARRGYGRIRLEREGRRRGLLGQASFLILNAHPIASSATLRGKFVREVLLCGTIPSPPANVNTALPEPTGDALTLRDRVREHLSNPDCAGCHRLMDPIGLGLERFDAVGRRRDRDRGARIDPSGDLDGIPFEDAWTLGQVLHDHPDVPGCFVRTLYRYAVAREEVAGEAELLALLTERFAAGGHRLRPLLIDIVSSPGFRRVAKEANP